MKLYNIVKKTNYTEKPDWCFASGMEKQVLSYVLCVGVNWYDLGEREN